MLTLEETCKYIWMMVYWPMGIGIRRRKMRRRGRKEDEEEASKL